MSHAIPKVHRGLFARAPRSRASAIKAMCLQCVGFARADVRACSDTTCPLHSWRPYQLKESPDSATATPRSGDETRGA